MKFKKPYNQKDVDYYSRSVSELLSKQQGCTCSISTSTWADTYGRPICSNCGKPIDTTPRTITMPYHFYEQK